MGSGGIGGGGVGCSGVGGSGVGGGGVGGSGVGAECVGGWGREAGRLAWPGPSHREEVRRRLLRLKRQGTRVDEHGNHSIPLFSNDRSNRPPSGAGYPPKRQVTAANY